LTDVIFSHIVYMYSRDQKELPVYYTDVIGINLAETN